LNRGNAVSETQGDALRLGADANVACKFTIVVILLLDGDIDQSIFSKNTLCREKEFAKRNQ
jgi:hypothetical protein